MKTRLFVQTLFEGFHCWPEAPEQVAFLRSVHRHIFHVKVCINVVASREIEFFLFKAYLNRQVQELIKTNHSLKHTMSCEQMAAFLMERIANDHDIYSAEVSEDGENGATVYAA